MRTQLLCTFCTTEKLAATIQRIKDTYHLVFNNVYVLDNTEDSTQCIITYNIDPTVPAAYEPPESTISVHRKKQTNTIYTINALNNLIMRKNNGVLDKSYKVDWEELNNMVMVTAHGELKLIKTKIQQIITLGT